MQRTHLQLRVLLVRCRHPPVIRATDLLDACRGLLQMRVHRRTQRCDLGLVGL
jgi:hypothetical protein